MAVIAMCHAAALSHSIRSPHAGASAALTRGFNLGQCFGGAHSRRLHFCVMPTMVGITFTAEAGADGPTSTVSACIVICSAV